MHQVPHRNINNSRSLRIWCQMENTPSTVANFLPFLHPLLSSHSPRTDPGFVGFIHIFQLKLQTPKFDPMDIMRSMFLERSRWRHVLGFLWSLISEKQKSLFSAFQQWPVDVNQHNPDPQNVLEMHTFFFSQTKCQPSSKDRSYTAQADLQSPGSLI